MRNADPAAKKRGLRIHAIVFVLVLALLAVINLLTGPPYWVLFVLVGWGIGLLAHWWSCRTGNTPAATT
jgi:uncharacterized membrane protein